MWCNNKERIKLYELILLIAVMIICLWIGWLVKCFIEWVCRIL